MTNAQVQTTPRTMLLRKISDVMATDNTMQERLDKLVRIIATSLRVQVTSIYLLNDNKLELCATHGLNPESVHNLRVETKKGLVGSVFSTAQMLNIADTFTHLDLPHQAHIGQDNLHAFLGVPLLRGGRTLGVLTLRRTKAVVFSDLEVETLLTIAILLAELAVEIERTGGADNRMSGIEFISSKPQAFCGTPLAPGLAKGAARLHAVLIPAEILLATDPTREHERINKAIHEMRDSIDALINGRATNLGGATRDIFESYRLFAYDPALVKYLREGVMSGLSAEGAVERVRSQYRARLLKSRDPYLRARLHDLEDLTNRLLRSLANDNMQGGASLSSEGCPENAIIFARNLGAAEVLEYAEYHPLAIVLEEGTQGSHAAIICRALSIPMIGQAENISDCLENGDEVLVDSQGGMVYLRPDPLFAKEFDERLLALGRQREVYTGQKDKPCISKNGQAVSLLLNTGLLLDLAQIETVGARGIGLFRTEMHFMIASSMPRLFEQIDLYKKAFQVCEGKKLTFRTLDLGGDKILPYGEVVPEENPAMGWRAIRIGLTRPSILRYQLRALCVASEGRPLRVMFPMVACVEEFLQAKKYLLEEIERQKKLGAQIPEKLEVGVMLETPALLWQMEGICKNADFVSVGANDLMQFLFAADRNNVRTNNLYDTLHIASVRVMADIFNKCQTYKTPVSVCGEMAGRPLEALCLLALGYRELSMSATSIGPVKDAILSTDIEKLRASLLPKLQSDEPVDLRAYLQTFCLKNNIPIEGFKSV